MSRLTGVVDSQLRPIIRISVVGRRVSFSAWIDLGFEGDLVLPFSERDRLGVFLTGETVDVWRGDGTPTSMPLGRLPIRLFGRSRNGRLLFASDSDPAIEETSGEPLAVVGLALLRGARLTIDLVPQGAVVLERPIPTA